MRRQSKNGKVVGEIIDNEMLSVMEGKLNDKLNEYTVRLMGGRDFGKVAKEQGEKEERERDFPTALSEKDEGATVGVAELYATEDLFASIASDFKTLVLGSCHVAESICTKKRTENRETNARKELGAKDYETAVSKAESYLEAFETFYRDRLDAVKKGRKTVEFQLGDDKNNKVLRNVGSFLRGVFTNPLSTTTEFDTSWQQADGIKSNTNVTEIGEINPTNYDNFIRAHKNEESFPDISLYEHTLSANTAAYCFGKKAKEDATERSNRLLARWISLHLQTKNESADNIELNTTSSSQSDDFQYDVDYQEQRLFHIVMRQNAEKWNTDGSQRTEEWLRRMESLQQGGHFRCAPDIHAYNLVLLSYCNLCKSTASTAAPQASNADDGREHALSRATRTYVMSGVEKIMSEIRDLDGVDADVLTLNLALNAMGRAGRHEVDTSQKTDMLLQQVLGEEGFNDLLDETQCPALNDESDKIELDLDSYHWLINIYSSSGNLAYITRAMSLLNKMIKMRMAIDSSGESEEETTTPSTGTFNNALRALQCKVDELARLSRLSKDDLGLLSEQAQKELRDYSPTDIAKSSAPIIDAMVQFESSLPTRLTFIFLLQLWVRSGSVVSGDKANEILSRMELISSYNPLMPFSNAYRLALKSWQTSAEAGRPGAVDKANR
jgi:hypothetical protein